MLLNWAILIVMTVVGLAAWYYYKKLTHKDKRQVEAGLPASYGQAMTLAYELGGVSICPDESWSKGF